MIISGWIILNLYTMLLLILLLIFQSGMIHVNSSKQFVRLLTMTLCLLLAESIGRVGEIYPQRYLFLAKAGYFFIFLFDPVEYLLAIDYIDKWMEGKQERPRKVLLHAFQIFACLNFVLVLISTLFNFRWFYYFEDLEYFRGEYFYIRGAMMMIYCLLLDIYAFAFRKNISFAYRTAILMLPVLSLFGAIGQIYFADMDLTYAMITVGCVLLFFYLQGNDVNGDYLTGAYNRRGIDMRLSDAVNNAKNNGKIFSAIMIDIDHFKEINDKYGHLEGDQVLKEVAEILFITFGSEGMVGRYGGDEFCIIIYVDNNYHLTEKIAELMKNLDKLNGKNVHEFSIKMSCGYAVYDLKKKLTAEEFLMEIDELMYKQKLVHHLKDKRRKDRRRTE